MDTASEAARPVHLNPSQLLELEADDAQAAITALIQEMRRQVQAGADPKRLTREHPWVAVGSAAVAGFVGAMLAVPSKEDAALKRLAKIERALNAESAADSMSGNQGAKSGHPALRKFAMRMFKMLQPTLLAAVTGALTGKSAQGGDDDTEDNEAAERVVVEDQIEQPPPAI